VAQARVADSLRRGLSAARFLTPFVRDTEFASKECYGEAIPKRVSYALIHSR